MLEAMLGRPGFAPVVILIAVFAALTLGTAGWYFAPRQEPSTSAPEAGPPAPAPTPPAAPLAPSGVEGPPASKIKTPAPPPPAAAPQPSPPPEPQPVPPPPPAEERYGNRTPFYSSGGIKMEYYWPQDPIAPNLSAEETEFLVYNETAGTMEITSLTINYTIGGAAVPIYSGTWESFPSRQSWERMAYVNIGQASYAGSLRLGPGEKGKIHHHITRSGSGDHRMQLAIAFRRPGGAAENYEHVFTLPASQVPPAPPPSSHY